MKRSDILIRSIAPYDFCYIETVFLQNIYVFFLRILRGCTIQVFTISAFAACPALSEYVWRSFWWMWFGNLNDATRDNKLFEVEKLRFIIFVEFLCDSFLGDSTSIFKTKS